MNLRSIAALVAASAGLEQRRYLPLTIGTHIAAPAHWASYLLEGGPLEQPGEQAQADAWLARERVRIVGLEPDAEPYFSWGARLLVPELGVDGCMMLDYRAEELSL